MTRAAGIEGTYKLPDSAAGDLEQMGSMIAEVQAGELSLERFRAFRVPMGIYEQREDGTYMLRVRFPAGGVLPHQMRTLADVSELHGNGVLHVTTRQDIQVHRVLLDAIHPALLELHAAGLSTKGGGGNTVRNIIACPHAGVCPHEPFDVTPHAIALTEFLLPDPLSFQLPRKYKIAFAGCGVDCAGATVNDVGLIAKMRDGIEGFAVYVGGGMGAKSRVADLLHEFVPVADVPIIAEAVKRVFDQHGNRKDRHRARLRFLIERIGLDAFRELYEAELVKLGETPPPTIPSRPLPAREPTRPGSTAAAGGSAACTAWLASNVVPQKQDGYYLVDVPLTLGDIAADALRALANVVEAYGEGMARTTQQQNLVLRWVAGDELPAVHGKLAALGLADAQPPLSRNMAACAGASTCRLGICLARGLATAVDRELSANGLDLAALGDLKIHISGCPNSCGRHRVADIGLYGAARRVDDHLVPHYVVQLGGCVVEGSTRLAEGRTAIPARNVPAFIKGFLTAYARSGQCPDYGAWLDAAGRKLADDLLVEHQTIPPFELDKNPYYDWDGTELFSLAGRGPGECSVGVFDLIEVDLGSAEQSLAQGKLFAATALAARALLVTRGEEPKTDRESLELFHKHFVDAGLVDAALGTLVERALATDADSFQAEADEVGALVAAVRSLYDSMDDSLRFTAPTPEPEPEPATEAEADDAAGHEDYRGVACPLNYVKAKVALEKIQPGEILDIVLGAEGAQNVPESARKDGHEVLSVAQDGDHWRIQIRKGKG